MSIDHQERMRATAASPNMSSYEDLYRNFDWSEVEKQFTWHVTGKVNMAHEAIDRHVAEGRGDKTALCYSDAEREESYTFDELRRLSNRFSNVLRKLGVGKGQRLFIFMPRTPELYVAMLGSLKSGVVVGPLFEAFMETAVKDRLLDSGASAIVTTPELLQRIKRDELPELKHIIVVGGLEHS